MTRFGLLRAELRRNIPRLVGLSLGVAVGVSATALVLVLRSDSARMLALWAPASDRSLSVEPPRLVLGGLGGKLDNGALARLRALPAVESAIPRMLLRAPAMSEYRGAFFGQNLDLTIELAAEGVSEEAMAAALFPGEHFEWRKDRPLPVCVSEGLVAIYNSTFAPARNLPQLDARLLRGFELPVTIGRSMIAQRSPTAETLQARVVCVSPDAMLAGLTIPLTAARELNRSHGADGETYSSVTLVARGSSDLPALEKGVVEAGFRVGEGESTARRLGRVLRLGGAALLAVAGLLLVLAAALVAVAFYGTLRARAGELRLLSALGATRGFLTLQAIAEAMLVGVWGGVLGLAVAWLVGIAESRAALVSGIILPLSIGQLEPREALTAATAGVVAAVLGAMLAVQRMSR